MKTLILLLSLTSAPVFAAAPAAGTYVCAPAETPGDERADAHNVANVLNSLGCDNAKPVTTMADNTSATAVIVCCVHK